MPDRRQIIIDRFARWAAASAARQGSKVRGRKWYHAIDNIDFTPLLRNKRISREEFDRWHRREVKKLDKTTGSGIGWAAKILDMVTKVKVYLASLGPPELTELIHPPIDNFLIDAVKDKYRGCADIVKLCSIGKPISSLKRYEDYLRVIDGLRIVADKEGCSLFEVECFWEDAPRTPRRTTIQLLG